MMNLFQAGAIVAATSAGFARGMMGEVSEEEKKGVAKYSKMVMVRLESLVRVMLMRRRW